MVELLQVGAFVGRHIVGDHKRGEGEALESLFRRTREIRRSIVEAGQAGTFLPAEPAPPASLTGEPGAE